MRSLNSSRDSTRDMLTEKLVGTIPKLLIGALMGVVVGFGGAVPLLGLAVPLGALLAVGLVVAGFAIDVVMASQHGTRKKREITRFFDKEIGAALGKDPAHLTVRDAEAAARGETITGEPLLVVQNCFVAIDKAQRQETIVSMISTVLTAVFSFGAGAVLGGLFSGSAGAAVGEAGKQAAANAAEVSKIGRVVAQSLFGSTTMKIVTDSVTQAYNSYHPVPFAPPVFEGLRKLEGRMDYNDPIPAFPLMSLVLQLRPALQERIKEEYGASFDQLDQLQKREAFLEMEELLHLKEAARKLTHGEITLPQFGVMLFGQHPASPPPSEEYSRARAASQKTRAVDMAVENAKDEGRDEKAAVAELEASTETKKEGPVQSFVQKHRPERLSQNPNSTIALWKDKVQTTPSAGTEHSTLGFH